MSKEPLIRMEGIVKNFGGVHAVDHVDLELWPGEVLAVVGENAAGKSTLIKVLTGVYKADGGRIFMNGEELHIHSRQDAKSHGIDAVYQELGLVDTLDVPANIFLGQWLTVPIFGGIIRLLNHRKMYRESQRILAEQLGVNVDRMKAPVYSLSGGQRQSIAIARAVYRKVKVLVMDEPTAALGQEARARTFAFIQRVKELGVGIIYIGHNLEDIFCIADRIEVLRTGRCIAVKKREETNRTEIVGLIAGLDMTCPTK